MRCKILKNAKTLYSAKNRKVKRFWATVCKTVHPIAIGPLSVLSCLNVCL